MISHSEARYVVTEIIRLPFYAEQIEKARKVYKAYEEKKRQIADPSCPQGHEVIGQKGNEVSDPAKILTQIVTAQEIYREKILLYRTLQDNARWYWEVLMEGDNAQFVKDYFGTQDKKTLLKKYNISNAYDRIIRVVKGEIKQI